MRAALRRLIVRADEWLARYIDRRVCANLYGLELDSVSPDRISGVGRIGDVTLYPCCPCCLAHQAKCPDLHRTPCDREFCAQRWAEWAPKRVERWADQ